MYSFSEDKERHVLQICSAMYYKTTNISRSVFQRNCLTVALTPCTLSVIVGLLVRFMCCVAVCDCRWQWKTFSTRTLGTDPTPCLAGARWRLPSCLHACSSQPTVVLRGGSSTMRGPTDRFPQSRQVDLYNCLSPHVTVNNNNVCFYLYQVRCDSVL